MKFGLLCGGLVLMAQMATAQRGAPPPPPPPPHGGAGNGTPGGPPNAGAPTPHAQGATAHSASGSGQFGPPGRWWDDGSVRKSIGLTTTQQKKMDSIFDANKSTIVSSYQTLQTQQAKLDALNKQTSVDSKALMSQIDAVNTARSSLQKATSAMLLQLKGQMDTSQIEKLQQIQ